MIIRARLSRADGGVSLVELIVGVVVAGLFVSMLAVMFVNGWIAQKEATERDDATGHANLAAATLHASVRNAATFRVAESGTRLDAVVALKGPTMAWECRAWKLAGAQLYYSAGGSARPADIVSGSSPIVTGVTGTLTAGGAFQQGTGSAEAQRRLTIGMTVRTGDQSVVLSDAVVAQTVVQGGAPACW